MLQTLTLPAPRHRQSGLTLVELMVALVISLIVVLVAATALLASRQGFTQVDAATQLRENARYAEHLIQRVAVQAGYRDVITFGAPSSASTFQGMSSPRPAVFGFDNRERQTEHNSEQAEANERAEGSPGFGSDILVLRYQSAKIDGSNNTDGGFIDCAGNTIDEPSKDKNELFSNVFHIRLSNGEPNLMCTRWSGANDSGSPTTLPIISGVENFQVLYGVDGISDYESNTDFSDADSIAETFLRADQITVPNNEELTRKRWQRVRSIRIGMILRASPGTAFSDANEAWIYPFGSENFFSDEDPGTRIATPQDGRLRQQVSFTIHLRNHQGDE